MTRFIVGIDLGTTNTVVAYAEKSAGPDTVPAIFELEQLVALGEVAARPSLPSLRYHPAPGELDPGDLVLPWAGTDVAAPRTVWPGRCGPPPVPFPWFALLPGRRYFSGAYRAAAGS